MLVIVVVDALEFLSQRQLNLHVGDYGNYECYIDVCNVIKPISKPGD